MMTATERAAFLSDLRAMNEGPRPMGNSFGIDPEFARWNERARLIAQMEQDNAFVPDDRVVAYIQREHTKRS